LRKSGFLGLGAGRSQVQILSPRFTKGLATTAWCWLRALDDEPGPGRIDFFYTSTDGGAPFASELEGIADRHQELRLHLVNSTVDGRLTPDEVVATAGDDPAALSVFLCGPEGMVRTFQSGLHRAGVPRKAIHREYFIWR
jgi:predicted ferric reductase